MITDLHIVDLTQVAFPAPRFDPQDTHTHARRRADPARPGSARQAALGLPHNEEERETLPRRALHRRRRSSLSLTVRCSCGRVTISRSKGALSSSLSTVKAATNKSTANERRGASRPAEQPAAPARPDDHPDPTSPIVSC
ncbi:Ubiquitin carboxyl-terminal hydrolase 33 [Frankliniella fusca]|uniref:Ubiquitin carboxyl-terminal hydrolase 33 n=1 Tax=Frankliniella fusca TaxID=407009 RepID=A0AAE1H730_9NEOP|nr:Ubiquitin carboxyl-terminal hydrolase 33 [Frankliniella fusca]